MSLFLTGFIILLVIVAAFSVTAVASHVIMARKKRSDYALGLRVAEMARFARRKVGDIQGESLFVKLDLELPHLTVSGVSESSGTWSTDEVLRAEFEHGHGVVVDDDSIHTSSLNQNIVAE